MIQLVKEALLMTVCWVIALSAFPIGFLTDEFQRKEVI